MDTIVIPTPAQRARDAALARDIEILENYELLTTWLGTASSLAAVNLATTALQTAWTGTAVAASAVNVADNALIFGWAGTTAGNAAMQIAAAGTNLANSALQTAWAGTATGSTALQTAWTGTGAASSANSLAYTALQTAWTGTAAAGATTYLSANTTFYVNGTASDSNNGSVNSPFKTIQHAVNILASNYYVFYPNTVTIKLADGTYNENVTLTPVNACGGVTIVGNTSTPGNVIVDGGSSFAFLAGYPIGIWHLSGMELRGTYGVWALNGGRIFLTTGMQFGLCSVVHMNSENGSYIELDNNYTIVATGGLRHYSASGGGTISANSITVTISNTPAFSDCFAFAANAANMLLFSITFSGSATGKRYVALMNGVIDTRTANANYFPGNSAGDVLTGGQYA